MAIGTEPGTAHRSECRRLRAYSVEPAARPPRPPGAGASRRARRPPHFPSLVPSLQRTQACGPRRATMSTSPPCTRARRARMRQPCRRRYQQARVSAPRPRCSAAWRFTWPVPGRGHKRVCAGRPAARRLPRPRARASRRRIASVERCIDSGIADIGRRRRRPDNDHDLALGRRFGIERSPARSACQSRIPRAFW